MTPRANIYRAQYKAALRLTLTRICNTPSIQTRDFAELEMKRGGMPRGLYPDVA